MTGPVDVRVHPTAIVEEGVELGPGTRVWDNAHVRHGARIGRSCIIGDKSYIAYDVSIGDFCKLNTGVYVCAGVTLGDFVMISAHVVFTNDRFPRAGNVDLTGLETSDVTEETLYTTLERGVTVGANATIGPGITIGEFAMVGMGSVVTHDVKPFQLVVGNPAHPAGWLCVCGHPLLRGTAALEKPATPQDLTCSRCERGYAFDGTLRLTRGRERD